MLNRLNKTSYFIFALLVGATFMFQSCGDVEEVEDPVDEVVVDEDYYEFQDVMLDKYDIPALIKLPDETANIGASTKPEIQHVEDDIKWTINIGPNFRLLIEDYGHNKDLVKVEKKELAETDFYKIKYIIDEPNLILYERTLVVDGNEKAAPSVGIEHRSYHVYGQKTIGDITYELQSREEGYEKVIIELMAKSIKSFKGIEEE